MANWCQHCSLLARRLQKRQTVLGVNLQELERAGKVKLTEVKGKLVVGLRMAYEHSAL